MYAMMTEVKKRVPPYRVDETTSSKHASSESHESIAHSKIEDHHHHSHGTTSVHKKGHHVLQVEGLDIEFRMYDDSDASFFSACKKRVPIIEDLHISVHHGEIVALVGASGSGKTLLADAIMGLYEPNVSIRGNIWFEGVLQTASSLTKLRGREIAFVPQSVVTLDPLMKVGKQLRGFPDKTVSMQKREAKIDELLESYHLDASVKEKYPFELSGGMARRVLLISALVEDPQLIIADEPTPGLDLELATKALDDFRSFADCGGGVLLITHDIELALKVADRVAVFKEGTVVEETSVENFSSPETLQSAFSKQLWHALPEHGFKVPEHKKEQ